MSYLQQQISQLIQIANSKEEPYYEVLQSITFSGNEYFDTGVLGDANTKIEAGIFLTSMPSVEADGNYYIFGSRSGSATANNIDCIWSWQSGLVCDFNNSAYATYRLSVSKTNLALNTVYDVTVNKNKRDVSRNGTSLGSNTTANSDTFTSTNTICIGLVKGANISSYTGFNGGLKYFKINNDDYIPVLDSQKRPCLYNRTTKTFLYAKKITDGTDATSTLTYKRWNKYSVDYIQSSGTEYINTGYVFQDDFAYEIEYEGLNNGECLIGGRTSSTRTAILYRAMATQVDGQTTVPIAGLNATQTPFKLGVLSDTKHKVKVAIANNKGNIWLDDTQIYTNQSFTGTYISGKTTAIFADHFGDLTGTSEYQEYATSKLYALKFWQGTTLIRDYKPVVWHNGNTTAVACLYDEVYNKIYTNAGTGSLKAYITDISTTKTDVFTTTGATSGKAINAEGQIINSSASSYSALLPIVGGTVIECVSGNTGNNNYRFHCYDSSGTWIEQSLVLYPEGAGTVSPITGSFTAPANAKYVRVSYATQASSTIQVKSVTETIYEVGSGIQSTAKTEYVELDYFPDKDTSLECWTTVTDWGYVPTQYSYRSTNIFGSGSVSTDDSYTFGVGFDGSLTMGRRAGTPITGMNASINTKYIIYQDKDVAFYNNMTSYNDTPLYYGTEEEPLIPPDVQAQGNTLTVFKNPLSAVIGTMKIHYFKINENYRTVREAIPVKSGSTIGLYDKASKRFFGNSGSGTFTFNSLD